MEETEHDLARRLDSIEAAASADQIEAAPAPIAQGMGLAVREVGGATLLMAPAVPLSLFNRAIGLGMHRPATEGDVDAILAAYRDAGSKVRWIHVGPTARPAELPSWLAARGLAPTARPTWAKVVRGVEPPPPVTCSLTVHEVRPEEALELGRVLAIAHETPPPMIQWLAALVGRPRWRSYGVFDGEKLVGGGFLFADGDGAWLAWPARWRSFAGAAVRKPSSRVVSRTRLPPAQPRSPPRPVSP